MFENNFVFGACIFLVSIGILFNKRQHVEAVQPSLKSTAVIRSALIDLRLPSSEKKGIQNVLNDEILAKSVTGKTLVQYSLAETHYFLRFSPEILCLCAFFGW